MNLYINGDSNSCGAELVNGYCFASDDPRYPHMGELAHPECLEASWGYLLSKALNAGFYCEAISASSNDRILRTCTKFLDNLPKQATTFVIGWTTWEREEWLYENVYYQVNASGTDSVPDSLKENYKRWVSKQTPAEFERKEETWHKKIFDFHKTLQSLNIKHLFFNSYNHFKSSPEFDWEDCYVEPYSASGTYFNYLKEQGYDPIGNGMHHGSAAQSAWSQYILSRLTTLPNASNIVRVTQPVDLSTKKI